MKSIFADIYGTKPKAIKALKEALANEQAYTGLFDDEKETFHRWMEKNAGQYEDGDELDFVGGFYDWLEA